jgi:hypothetical protein
LACTALATSTGIAEPPELHSLMLVKSNTSLGALSAAPQLVGTMPTTVGRKRSTSAQMLLMICG